MKQQRPQLIFGNSPEDPNYLQALGRFIEVFAATESVIFSLLPFYANLSRKMALALFRNTPTDRIITQIRDLIAVTNPVVERKQELEAILSQFDAIKKARNDIIHYFPFDMTTGDKVYIKPSHLPQHARWRPMSADVLDAMTKDLHKIHKHAVLHTEFPAIDDTRGRLIDLPPNEAWHYEPPQDHEMKP